MAADQGRAQYVIPVARVRESITELLSRSIHPYFIAYLHLRRLAGKTGQTSNLAPNWADLGSILEVPGAPEGRPFLRPFWQGQRAAGQEWLNKNLAGSFAASSLRGVPLRVVETDAEGRFTLRDDHAKLALEHLLGGIRVPLLAVAGFLFRDYGISGPEHDRMALVDAFWWEYGYHDQQGEEFLTLYDLDWQGEPGEWLEAL